MVFNNAQRVCWILVGASMQFLMYLDYVKDDQRLSHKTSDCETGAVAFKAQNPREACRVYVELQC